MLDQGCLESLRTATFSYSCAVLRRLAESKEQPAAALLQQAELGVRRHGGDGDWNATGVVDVLQARVDIGDVVAKRRQRALLHKGHVGEVSNRVDQNRDTTSALHDLALPADRIVGPVHPVHHERAGTSQYVGFVLVFAHDGQDRLRPTVLVDESAVFDQHLLAGVEHVDEFFQGPGHRAQVVSLEEEFVVHESVDKVLDVQEVFGKRMALPVNWRCMFNRADVVFVRLFVWSAVPDFGAIDRVSIRSVEGSDRLSLGRRRGRSVVNHHSLSGIQTWQPRRRPLLLGWSHRPGNGRCERRGASFSTIGLRPRATRHCHAGGVRDRCEAPKHEKSARMTGKQQALETAAAALTSPHTEEKPLR